MRRNRAKFASAAGWNLGFMLDATPPKNAAFWKTDRLGSRETEGSLAR